MEDDFERRKYKHLMQLMETAPLHPERRDDDYYRAIGRAVVDEVDMYIRSKEQESESI